MKNLFVLILVLAVSTASLRAGDDIVIKVNNRKISAREFMNRLNSLPRVTKSSPEDQKEDLICTLIAESVLSYESTTAKLDTAEQYRLIADEYHKEALYEQWMNEEVRGKVRYSEQELRDTYEKLREKRTVEFWTFSSKKEASAFKSLAQKDSSVVTQSQTKTLEGGEALEDVEDSIYALKIGEMTEPIQIDQEYYIFRLKSTGPHPKYSKQNYIYWIKDSEDLVKARKEEQLLNAALLKVMVGKEFTLDNDAYDYLLSKLYPIIYGENNQLKFPKSEMIQYNLLNFENKNIDINNKIAIRFQNGKEWTVNDLWKKITVCPYPLNYKNPEDLQKGLFDVIRNIILLESIADDSQKKGYGDSVYAREETDMWKTNSSAYAFITSYSRSLHFSDQEIQTFYDSTKYNFIKPESRKIIYIQAATKNLADEIYKKAISGTDFQDLYRTYQKDGKTSEEDMSSYITEGMWGEIGKKAFKLKRVGDISAPFLYLDSSDSTDSSYVVVKMTDIRRAAPYPLEDIRDRLDFQKRFFEVSSYVDSYMTKAVKNYKVSINRELINKIPVIEGDMTVKKTHFPLRNSVPDFYNFSHKAQWYQDLLKRLNDATN